MEPRRSRGHLRQAGGVPVRLLLERPRGGVGVARADETELVGVGQAGLGDLEAAVQGVAHVAALGLAQDRGRDAVRHDLEPGPLVVRRQRGVGLGGALRLGDLDRGLVARAQVHVCGVDGRLAVEVGELEHAAAGPVHVVRDRQGVDTGRAPRVHRLPEVFGVERVEPGERRRGRVAAAEDDVAVQVVVDAARTGGRVLVGDEGGVASRVVVAVRARDDLAPGRAHDIQVEVLAHGGIRVFHVADVGLQGPEDAAPLGRGPRGAHRLRRRMVVRRLLGIEHRRQHAQVVGVVAHAVEVERPVELHREPGRMLDGVALGELVRGVRVGTRAEDEGIVRVRGVDVQVAEERLPLGEGTGIHERLVLRHAGDVGRGGVLGWRLFRCRFAPGRQQSAQKQQSESPHDLGLPQFGCWRVCRMWTRRRKGTRTFAIGSR